MDKFRSTVTPGQTIQKRNNLDESLDSIFENKLRFQIERRDVKFIQTAVESLTKKLLQMIRMNGKRKRNDAIDEFLRHYREFQFICMGTENSKSIFRAGSFYEKTKNSYPDEFEYMYVICTLEATEEAQELIWQKEYFTLNYFHAIMKRILTRILESENYFFYADDDQRRVVLFHAYNKGQGPSSKLTFRFFSDMQSDEYKNINVDIVPAFKIIDKRLPERIRKVCDVKGFAEEISVTGSYFITNEVFFTETEIRFMRENLSHSHRKAYRLLEYIINGSGDREKLKQVEPTAGISTYMLKVATIRHHYKCEFGDETNNRPSQCVITILEELMNHCLDFSYNDFPHLKKFHGGSFEMRRDLAEVTVHNIERMLKNLRSLQNGGMLTLNIKSISESILEDIKMESSVSRDSKEKRSKYGSLMREKSKSKDSHWCTLI